MVFKSSCLVDLVAFSSQCALLSISSDAGQSGTLVGFPPSGGSSAGGGGGGCAAPGSSVGCWGAFPPVTCCGNGETSTLGAVWAFQSLTGVEVNSL